MSSKYLMNNILRETSRVALIKSLQDRPSHDSIQFNATLRHVQLGVKISDSRLDDELSVATIKFHLTPQWLSQDRSSFPKYTPLGTIWNAVDRHAIDEHGRTEFMRAVMKGNSHMELLYAEMLAEFDDTDVNVQDDRGRTALHWACALFHQDMVRLCLSVPDCNTGLLDHDGLTAFDISLRSGSEDETIPNLFYRNIIEIETLAPQTALLRVLTITSEPATASSADKPVFPGFVMFDPAADANEPLVAALIARGIDPTATDKNGDTALHMAAAAENNLGIVSKLGVVSKLINAGWDVNAIGNEGATPLHRAVRTRDVEVVKLLLDHKANVGPTDDQGQTALKLAQDLQCEDLVDLLKVMPDVPTRSVLAARPDTNEILRLDDERDDLDSKGRSQLHRAARGGHTETVLALLADGASLDIVDLYKNTPLHYAAINGHTEILSALLVGEARVDPLGMHKRSPLHYAAIGGHTESVLALLASGASVDRASTDQETALHFAVRSGHTESVSALLAGGASVNPFDLFQNTPLHYAARNGDRAIVSALLARGANVDPLDLHYNTPLHLAAENGHSDTVLALLAGGASVDVLDQSNNSALHLAARKGHTEIVSALVARGASINLLNQSHLAPVREAALHGHAETVLALLASGASADNLEESRETAPDFAVDNRDNILQRAEPKSKVRRLADSIRGQWKL